MYMKNTRVSVLTVVIFTTVLFPFLSGFDFEVVDKII